MKHRASSTHRINSPDRHDGQTNKTFAQSEKLMYLFPFVS